MTATIGLLAVVVVLIAVLVYERRRTVDVLERFARQWEGERRELITRIQRPDLVPVVRRRPQGEQEERPRDVAALQAVGQVQTREGKGPRLASQTDLED